MTSVLKHWLRCLILYVFIAIPGAVMAQAAEAAPVPSAKAPVPAAANPKPAAVAEVKPAPAQPDVVAEEEDDEKAAEKKEAEDTVKVARPVSSDPVQVYGWREKVRVGDMADLMVAKLDSGATTSSLHAENQQIFEKDGKKWVKFVITDPNQKGAKRYEMEAPLTRTVAIKDPGGESERRNVVRLNFQIGDRNIKSEFTLNNRHNMSCPVLIGRTTIKSLGWIDSSRTYLADDKIFR